jgi:hypothetical protein
MVKVLRSVGINSDVVYGAALIALAAFVSFVLSVVLWFTDSREEALFVGLWVPSILSLGAFYAALGGGRS